MTSEQRAQLAQSLKDNEAFQAVLDQNRQDALEGLAHTPATDTEAIRDHQAMVRIVDEIRSNLDAFIRAERVRGKPGIA